MQNKSDKYPSYQKGDHAFFFIEGKDYNENRVDLYIEAAKVNTNVGRYGSSFFVGNNNQISRLIVIKEAVEFIVFVVLLIAAILLIVVHRKDIYGVLLGSSALILLFNFKVGMICIVFMIYMYSDKLFKKRIKKYFLLVVPVLCLFLPFEYFSLYVCVLMIIGLRNYYKHSDVKTFLAYGILVAIFAFSRIDLEFSLFRLFYESFHRLFIAMVLFTISVLSLRFYFSKEKLIRVDLLRGMSHDIRVPLSTIRLNTEILAKGDFESEINRGKTLHIITGAIDDLMNLTTGLTSYISSDMYVGHRFRTSVQDCIEQSIGYFYNNEKEIDVKRDIYVEEQFLSIDKVWLNRLIYNLLDNAYKYTDRYGKIV